MRAFLRIGDDELVLRGPLAASLVGIAEFVPQRCRTTLDRIARIDRERASGGHAFARGDAPMTCVEFARRNIEPNDRPSFAELEALTRRKAA